MKDERRPLNRKIMHEKLIYEAKRSIVGSLLILFLSSVVYGMLCLVLTMGLPSTRPILIIAWIAGGLFGICYLVYLVRGVLALVKAQSASFTVAEESLVGVETDQFSWHKLLISFNLRQFFQGRHFNYIFLFESGKKFVADSGEYQNTHLDTAAKYSLEGDRFFVVTYDDAPDKIVLLFSAKTYQYQG
jgi:uncharacterized membrane protein YdcZ (DUF606 family)